ncbi:MAG: (deoxy)nucleoside triphosphate pyrophosphohydrolase [Methanobrevibacter sp.]|uniref:(deoxy)nucleoside triphosphate pyrophosphohydrolase n=1 Tax=Methanobrevibacter sp. TaxID=66852 RepID=UPI0026DF487B|nr:(deoxy)nucleoside triphosphate pyrophosphohydrolase [Methanobrevibacter sp.]MDO5849452.1 (deoxy)nucleoside triphosphate pyrophosphohydrolase [Methanobrevibacter sp.]
MKTVNVVAAIIRKGEKILATKRGYGEFENLWEFPGGKIEENETPEEALKREIMEELNASIEIEKFLINISYDYPDFHLNMDCYLCELKGPISLLEHKDACWIGKDEFETLDWIPADIEILEVLENEL